MNKKLIIDLNGVIFEPVDKNFAQVARGELWPCKGCGIIIGV